MTKHRFKCHLAYTIGHLLLPFITLHMFYVEVIKAAKRTKHNINYRLGEFKKKYNYYLNNP